MKWYFRVYDQELKPFDTENTRDIENQICILLMRQVFSEKLKIIFKIDNCNLHTPEYPPDEFYVHIHVRVLFIEWYHFRHFFLPFYIWKRLSTWHTGISYFIYVWIFLPIVNMYSINMYSNINVFQYNIMYITYLYIDWKSNLRVIIAISWYSISQ
jgi:hypothetical protein